MSSRQRSTPAFKTRSCPKLVVFVLCFLGSQNIFSRAAEESNSSKRCTDIERKALVAFKRGLTDPSGRLSSWAAGEDCCRWSGVGCNNQTGRVVKLDLRNPFPTTSYGAASMAEGDMEAYKRSCLGGNISSSLLHLEYLDYFDLSLNDFEGIQIPEFIGMFKNIQYLNLSSSSFAGEIPSVLGNLSSLSYLDLYAESYISPGMYELQAVSLEWVSGLTSLKHLNLGEVKLDQIEANWLQSVNTLPLLLELHLSWCNLQSLQLTLPFVNFTSLLVIDFSGNSINSTIPNWLVNLTSLQRLDLSMNSFGGSIPSDIVNLVSLEHLDLSSNGNIQGQLPRFLGNLCKLKYLDLSGNKFSGEIDEFLSAFSGCPESNLMSLDLSSNQLVGELPDSLGILTKLQKLSLTMNSFWGSIPSSIGSLSSLQELDLAFNNMNGTIPESFGQLSSLAKLYLQANSWEGVLTEAQLMNLTRLEHVIIRTYTIKSLVFNVTYDWIPPFRLKSLEMENCLVGPRFPVWLQVQSELTSVTVKNAGIADSIPGEWFSRICSQLTYLDLSNNQIEGRLPNRLESPKINAIDLSYNRFKGPLPLWSTNTPHYYLQSNLFSGPIPSNISELMPQLKYLYLSENNLSGTVPTSICTMMSLEVLSLRMNLLSGRLPNCWNESQQLWVVDVANNNLTGDIPSSIGYLRRLNFLMLSNNDLDGGIPTSLKNCSALTSIDLGGNRLSGDLPLWVGVNVTNLWMIRLRSNSFSGNIPRQWCNLPILHILDLAHNNITGVIPSCLANLTALVYDNITTTYNNFFRSHRYIYQEQAIVVAKGRELEYSRTLVYVNSIDLSHNGLVDEIPEEITDLIALGTLNLSTNHLSGSIPQKIGNLRWLETFDLSNNDLSGPIPPSLSSLTSLSHLNLSHNNFTGRIPSGNQLQTLNDSSIYIGNPFLCGVPLPMRCPGDDDTSNIPDSTDGGSQDTDGESDSEMLWFYGSMVLGFFVGLCGVCGTLLLKESWRSAYFQLFRIT